MLIDMGFKDFEVITTRKLEYFKKLSREDRHYLTDKKLRIQNSVYTEAKLNYNRCDIPYLANSEKLIGYKCRMRYQRKEASLRENSNIFFNANGRVHYDQLIIVKEDAGATVRLKY